MHVFTAEASTDAVTPDPGELAAVLLGRAGGTPVAAVALVDGDPAAPGL